MCSIFGAAAAALLSLAVTHEMKQQQQRRQQTVTTTNAAHSICSYEFIALLRARATKRARQRESGCGQSDSNSSVDAVEFLTVFRRATHALVAVAALVVVKCLAGATEMCFFCAFTRIYCLFMMPLSTLNCKFNRHHGAPNPCSSLSRPLPPRCHVYSYIQCVNRHSRAIYLCKISR